MDTTKAPSIIIPGQAVEDPNTPSYERLLQHKEVFFTWRPCLPGYDQDGLPDSADPDDNNHGSPDASEPALKKPYILNTSGGETGSDQPSEPSDGNSSERNPAQDQRLSKGEIKRLQAGDVDPEELKGGVRTGQLDLFKDKKGNIYVKPKDGSGSGENTGYNINDF